MIPTDKWRACLICLLCSLVVGCALPPLDGRTESQAFTQAETANTTLGQALGSERDAHPGLSGILTLAAARDAFAARMLLVEAAERSLDVQYYIWRNDITGTLLLDALLRAAERGVRVRLLLDDNGIADLDQTLSTLDRHPNIEVRLFNPFSLRQAKALGYLTHFPRANRRMHNKSFTVDNQATIIGGRNIGDEYFDASEGVLFADLDVLAIGPVVADTSADFDRYWASDSSYPLELIVPRSRSAPQPLHDIAADLSSSPAASGYVKTLQESEFIQRLLDKKLGFEWSETTLVSDDPAKGLGNASDGELLISHLGEMLDIPQARVDLVSPYFVPTQTGVDIFTGLVQRGVEVRILTNALEATDVTPVHAGYAKRRRALLEGGVKLYEMRLGADDEGLREKAGPLGSSGSSLHAKTFALDGQRVFIGSFNFDPRSASLNTEMGFLIESPKLAAAIGQAFESDIPANAYELRLDEHDRIYWLQRVDGEQRRFDSEPGTGPLKRLGIHLLSLLPIEWLL
nr:phospholipase D family protein [Pseudomonas chengduensis]